VVFLAFAGMALIFHHEKQEEVWAWLKSTAWPFVRTHWMWLWLAISVVGVLWTLMANGYLSTLYGWILSTILAALTAFGLWEGIMGQVSRALSGQNGASITLITWSMLLAGLAGLLHSLVPSDHQLEIIGWIAGLSMVLFWGGICRGVYEIKSKK
jgi:cation transport ATPase